MDETEFDRLSKEIRVADANVGKAVDKVLATKKLLAQQEKQAEEAVAHLKQKEEERRQLARTVAKVDEKEVINVSKVFRGGTQAIQLDLGDIFEIGDLDAATADDKRKLEEAQEQYTKMLNESIQEFFGRMRETVEKAKQDNEFTEACQQIKRRKRTPDGEEKEEPPQNGGQTSQTAPTQQQASDEQARAAASSSKAAATAPKDTRVGTEIPVPRDSCLDDDPIASFGESDEEQERRDMRAHFEKRVDQAALEAAAGGAPAGAAAGGTQ